MQTADIAIPLQDGGFLQTRCNDVQTVDKLIATLSDWRDPVKAQRLVCGGTIKRLAPGSVQFENPENNNGAVALPHPTRLAGDFLVVLEGGRWKEVA